MTQKAALTAAKGITYNPVVSSAARPAFEALANSTYGIGNYTDLSPAMLALASLGIWQRPAGPPPGSVSTQ